MTEDRNEVDLTKVRLGPQADRVAFIEQLFDTKLEDFQKALLRDSWVLDFAYAKMPISPNGSRGNHRAHAKKVRAVRTVTARAADGLPYLGRARAQLTWFVRTNGRRDPLNLALTLKAMVDGLVDAGIVTDDTGNLMHTPTPRIVRVDSTLNAEAWMELEITRWDGLR